MILEEEQTELPNKFKKTDTCISNLGNGLLCSLLLYKLRTSDHKPIKLAICEKLSRNTESMPNHHWVNVMPIFYASQKIT